VKRLHTATLCAILAAALYAINIPLSKLLLTRIPPTMMAAFLYLGAGVGLLIYRTLARSKSNDAPLCARDMPYVLGMIALDVAAPILLMVGLERSNAANASLLNNFEIVATSVFAFFLFKETVSRRLGAAIALVTLASITLSFEGQGSFDFNAGSLCVLGAACCWGMENNCTRMLSASDPTQITVIKGVFSGLGSLLVAFIAGEPLPGLGLIPAVMLLGFVSYGLSIAFYIRAQRDLGAAKTSAYYAIAPFLGAAFGTWLPGGLPGIQFYTGLVIMAVATVLMTQDTFAQSASGGQ